MAVKIHLAGRAPVDDHNLAWAGFPGPDRDPPWWAPHQMTDRGSQAGPALPAFGDQLFMAWRGGGDDRNLFYAALDNPNSDSQWSS
jgi:hypothetical protein